MGRKKLNRTNCKICGKKLDGASPVYCKKCHSKKVIENRIKKYGKVSLRKIPNYAKIVRKSDKEYQRKKRVENPGYKTAEFRRYLKRFPEKVRAHRILNQAVRKGQIKREPCQDCGRKTNIQGHHPDYSKPLEVRWLCPIHHKNYH